jgi:hypothetical protein
MREVPVAGWAKIFVIFPPYRFTHPKTDESIFVRRWSYLWAGLFGAIYVAYKGMASRFLIAVLVNLVIAVAALALTAITIVPRVPTLYQILILVGAVPTIIAVQGTLMIRIVREGYRRRGWKVRSGD